LKIPKVVVTSRLKSKNRQYSGQKKQDKYQENFEDIKGIIRSRISKDRQWPKE